MSSDDLINKYRPKNWDEMIGNNAVIKALMDSVDTKNAHQYLLVGQSGCGKTTAARIMADEFGDDNPYELDAATNNSVEDTRGIIEQLKYKSVMDNKKVFILDEAHMLSKAAWNSLLKSIEQPPAWAYWILCTTDVKRVPDTIKTRCFTAEFKPLNHDQLYDLLKNIRELEEFNTPLDVLDICVEQANGSPRQALANLAKCWNASADDAYELCQSVGESEDVIALVKALMDGKPWKELLRIMKGLEETNAESIRRVCLNYLTKVIMNTESDDKASRLLPILDVFSTPFGDEGLSPLVLAIGAFKFGGR